MIIPEGKYGGANVVDIPTEELEFVKRRGGLGSDAREVIGREIRRRQLAEARRRRLRRSLTRRNERFT